MANFNFQVEYNKWLKRFDSEDKNCILKQVQNMLFETLIYRCILKARAIAPKDNRGRIKLNGAVHYLIDKCFFYNQLMTIRRLTDKGEDVKKIIQRCYHEKNHRDRIILIEIFIGDREREECLRDLNKMNINHASLFPDIDGSAIFCNLRLEIDKY